jgi:DNA-binding NtrC family response regulator
MTARVLIIDDDEAIRDSLTIVLETAGFTVRSADACDSGLALARTFEPDVVLTDMTMPDADGTEVIAALKKNHPNVRIVAMSGGGRLGDKESLAVAREMGAHVTLPKPFDEDRLLAVVRGAT